MYPTTKSSESGKERAVQQLLRDLGYSFVTHARLPGTPDILLAEKRIVIRIQGCFYHRHEGCRDCTTPKRFPDHWNKKFAGIQARDRNARFQLLGMRYRLLSIWGCAIRDHLADPLRERLAAFIEGTMREREIGKAELLEALHAGAAGSIAK